jgi:predicted acylesterase/phospholipase RssA
MDSVLVFGGPHSPFAGLGVARRMGEGELHLAVNADSLARREIAVLTEQDVGRALRRMAARPVDVVVIDARRGDAAVDDATALLERLFPPHDVSGPARRLRTLVVVDGGAAGARLAFLAGTKRVADVLASPTDEALLARVLDMTGKSHGKIALCLAGGGVEGLLYEVGVLRALDHFLEARRVCDLDLYFGISAGSILGAFLANGLTPSEIADGLRRGSEKLDRITRRDVFDPNLGEVVRRAAGFLRDVVGMGEARNPLSALYRAIPSAAFRGDALREYLRRQLSRPGMTDHFEELRRPLYVGATDQDTSEAVVFGDTGWTDVPVHQAVRASCALAPFYAPERVGGRWYIDGAFTRTTNMRVAVKHGASMALIVDPLVPIYSEIAGYVRKKGGLFGTMQGLKALINGRFDKAVNTIREMYPEVAFHIFQPEADEMRILSGSPMKFLYREEIEELAYQRTLRKIRIVLPQLARDFARHDVAFREPPLRSRGESPFEDGLAAA